MVVLHGLTSVVSSLTKPRDQARTGTHRDTGESVCCDCNGAHGNGQVVTVDTAQN